MNANDLIDAGYKKFQDHLKGADCAYQKRIGSTRYFINVYYYDFRKHDINAKECFECDLCFNMVEDAHDQIRLLFNCTDLTIEQLESKVEWLFTTLGCSDYE
jgi:hypothetical protein